MNRSNLEFYSFHYPRISRADFQSAASIIVEAFPEENTASYYIPSVGDESAQGRLYQTYKSIRDELAEAGMITKRVMRKKESKTAEKTVANSVDVTTNVVKSIEYLTTHTDKKEEILEHWSKSRSERFRLVGQIPISEYLSKFPILSMANGFDWLNLDFAESYPTAMDAMTKWKEFSMKVIAYVKQKAKRNVNLRDIINSYDKSEAAQLLLSFKVLPWILRSPSKSSNKKRAKGTTRANQLEVSDSFLSHFNSENDDTRNEGSFIEVKLIGSTSKYDTFVYIDNIQYTFGDVAAGIDCAFKLYYVFNLAFPKTTAHVWEFLNEAIYNISITSKSNQAPNFEVLADIQRQKT